MGPRIALLRPGRIPYDDALLMQQRLADAVRGSEPSTLLLLEHPPTYTFGVRGKAEHLLWDEARLATTGAVVRRTDRGGDITYHGPGQLVGYPILDLRSLDIRGPGQYVRLLEQVLIDALAAFGIIGRRSKRNPGVWVGDEKVAAIGVRISRGVSTHGFAVNVNTDLSYFDAIVPCGLPGVRSTSMQALSGQHFDMHAVEDEVIASFARNFVVAFESVVEWVPA